MNKSEQGRDAAEGDVPAQKTWVAAAAEYVAGDWAWHEDVDSLGFLRRIWVNLVRFLSVTLGGS